MISITKENIEDAFPMSDASKGMLYHTLRETSSYMFHEQSVHFLKMDRLDSAVFEKVLHLLSRKHENLRSVFNMFDYDEPFQLVLGNVDPDLQYIDLTGKPAIEQSEFLKKWLEDDRNEPFDLRALRPLWKARVFFLDRGNICFAWITHHAVMDGWSTASLITEINNTYLRLLEEPDYVPEKLKCSYKDFVVEQMKEKVREEARLFWEKELVAHKRFSLPFLKPTASQLYHSAFLNKEYHFGTKLLEQLRKVANDTGCTLKNICFAAYVYTLYFYSDQQDFLLGLLSNSRPAVEDGDKVIGCFLNTLPFRVVMKEEFTWRTFITDIHNKVNAYLKYGRLSLLEIVKIAGERDDSQNPFFDVLFNYTDFHIYDELLSHETGESSMHDQRKLAEGVQKDNILVTFLFSVRNKFSCKLLYYDAVIGEEDADRLMEVYEKVLNKIAYSTEETASKPALFSAKEKEITSFMLERDYPLDSLLDVQVSGQALRLKEGPAIVSGGVTVSFGELEAASGRLADYLVSVGVGRGDYVGIYLERGADTVIAMIGVLKSGGAYLPLNPRLPSDRLKYMLEDSGCRLVISSAGYSPLLPSGVALIDIGIKDTEILFSREVAPVVRSSDDIAYLIYTSGTTGGPKGVMVSHRNVLNLIYGLDEMIYSRYGPGLHLGLVSPFDFDASVQHIYGALLLGHTLYIVPEDLRGDGRGLVEFYRDNTITVTDGTPTHLRILLESDLLLDRSLQHMLIAGEALPRTLVERFYEQYGSSGISITNLYGPTETCVDSTLFEVTRDSLQVYDTIPIGRALPNERIVILSEDGQLQGIGVPGEICIGGAGVSKGYLNKDGLTRSKFVYLGANEGAVLYRTGDIGKWLPDGNISYMGRKDDQVKLRGFRIELDEIRDNVLKYDKIKDAVVRLIEEEDEKQLCAYIIPTTYVEDNELKEFLKCAMPDYMIPHYIVQLNVWPVTPSGKIDLKALPHPFEGTAQQVKVKPVNESQEKLVRIWQQVLKGADIGVCNDFFSVGGDSIKLIKLLHSIKLEFNVQLSVQDFYQHTTIEKLDLLIRKNAEAVTNEQKHQFAGDVENFRSDFIHNL